MKTTEVRKKIGDDLKAKGIHPVPSKVLDFLTEEVEQRITSVIPSVTGDKKLLQKAFSQVIEGLG